MEVNMKLVILSSSRTDSNSHSHSCQMSFDVCLALSCFFLIYISLRYTPKILIKMNSFGDAYAHTHTYIVRINGVAVCYHFFPCSFSMLKYRVQSTEQILFQFQCGTFRDTGTRLFLGVYSLHQNQAHQNSNFFGNGVSTFTHSHAYQIQKCLVFAYMNICVSIYI